jgi:hypothetical protein
MKNLILIMFVLGLGVSAQAQRTGELDLFTPYFAQGLKEMKDLNYFGLSGSFAFRVPETPFSINAYLGGGQFNSRTEYLPMFTDSDGYADDVRIKSRGGITNFGLSLRISPLNISDMWGYPYIEVGGGYAAYRQAWNSRGVQRPDATPDCPKYFHNERGSLYRSGTFYGMGEAGIMFSYPGKDNTKPRAYFGFSVRYELGGDVIYANPSKKAQHFYYDSGLGAEFDRPFMKEFEANDRGLFDRARHQNLTFKLTALRLVF